MIEGFGLATAFAEHQPEEASRALEEMPAGDAALFLAELSPPLAAPLLEAMSPGSAARRLTPLPVPHAAAILLALDSRSCSAILRACPAAARRALLAELPPVRNQHYSRTLAYTLDTVGAWIDYDVPAIGGQRSVEDALILLRERGRAADAQVFVLRPGHLYAGVVATPRLLHASPEMALSRIADRSLRALSDTTDVGEVAEAQWDEYALLPVTAPDGTLLGGLSRAALRRAMHSVFPAPAAAPPESLLAHLFTAYLHAGAELMRLLVGPGRGTQARRDADER